MVGKDEMCPWTDPARYNGVIADGTLCLRLNKLNRHINIIKCLAEYGTGHSRTYYKIRLNRRKQHDSGRGKSR